jgi:hypothetical protein
MIVLIAIEGTFAQGKDLRTAAGYRGARPLYEALKGGYQLVALSEAPADICRWWLRKEHMSEWAQMMHHDADVWPEYSEWKVQKVREFLADGWEVAFYLDDDWKALQDVHVIGVSTLRIEHAQIRPGWRDPETTAPRAWADVAVTSEVLNPEGTHHGWQPD